MKNAKLNISCNCSPRVVRAVFITLIAVGVLLGAAIFWTTNRGGGFSADIETVAVETQVRVASGDTLSKILSEQNLSGGEIHTIAELLKRDCGISGLRADSDELILSRGTEDAPVDKIILISGPWKRVEMNCVDGTWSAQTIEIERDVRVVHRVGKIGDGDSFYLAGVRAGIPAGVIINVYDLLAFEIDFERDVRSGQEFSVLYEENYNGTEFVNNGNVIAVSFDGLRGNVKMYRFKRSDGGHGYYDENGNGAIKSLKRTPINNAKVTSSFSGRRKHPVLGFTRAHKGVDFRAGTGTPIPAAGSGKIIEKKYGKGYGNYITIKHNKSYSTRYGHMSRFQKGVNVGTQVKQGQIIGYVGSTGLSTGPHLHYEIIKDGVHVNPLTVKLPAIDNLDTANKKKFMTHRENVDNAIQMLSLNPSLFVQM